MIVDQTAREGFKSLVEVVARLEERIGWLEDQLLELRLLTNRWVEHDDDNPL